MESPPSYLRSTIVVATMRFLAQGMTLGLGMLSASYFGTSSDKDCYIIAQALPDLLSTVFVGGVYSTLMIALAEIGHRHGMQAQIACARTTLGRLMLMFGPLLLAAIFVPHIVIHLTAPGFTQDQVDLSARILTITMFTMAGTVTFAMVKALFNTWHRFAVPGLIHLVVGFTSIAVLVTSTDRFGILALAYGPFIGTFLSVLILLWLALAIARGAKGSGDTPSFGKDGGLSARRFWGDFLLMSIGANFGQVNILVDNLFASYLPTGSITMLGFGSTITRSATLLTVFALADVALPRLAAAAQKGRDALVSTLRVNLRYMIVVTAPLSAGALVFGTPIVRFLFERGVFGPDSTRGVAVILSCYSFEIFLMGIFALFWRTLVALRSLRFLAASSIVIMLANAALDYALIGPLGVNGLALATPLVTLIYILVLIPVLRRALGPIFSKSEILLLLKVFLSAGIMSGAVIGWTRGFEYYAGTAGQVTRLLEVFIGLILGALCYAGALVLFKVSEMREVARRLLPARGAD